VIETVSPRRLLACAIVAAGLAGVGLALAGASSAFRSPLVLLFLVSAPAMAVWGLLGGLDAVARVFVAVIAMVIIDICVPEAMLAANAWSPRTGLIVIVVICGVLAAARLARLARLVRLERG
jgi:hypothetical protein